MTDAPPTSGRTCEWCDSPMNHDGRAVCPSCGRLASRLAAMDPLLPPSDAPEPTLSPPAPPAPPAAVAPPAAAAPPPPPPPAAATPPTPPAPPAATPALPPAPPVRPPDPIAADTPRPPGSAWPTPAPLPPEDEGRAWWKIAVPAAFVVVLLVGGLLFATGGSGSKDGAASTKDAGKGSVDISDLEDPTTTEAGRATTTTVDEATTTVTTAEGRTVASSPSGISWSMIAAPEVEDIVRRDDTDDVYGHSWYAGAGDGTTEMVEITDLDGEAFTVDDAIADVAASFDGELSEIKDSHIAEVKGRTASFVGSLDNGDPVVGYVVAAEVDGEGVVVATWREDDDLQGLYLDFVKLPASFDLGR